MRLRAINLYQERWFLSMQKSLQDASFIQWGLQIFFYNSTLKTPLSNTIQILNITCDVMM